GNSRLPSLPKEFGPFTILSRSEAVALPKHPAKAIQAVEAIVESDRAYRTAVVLRRRKNACALLQTPVPDITAYSLLELREHTMQVTQSHTARGSDFCRCQFCIAQVTFDKADGALARRNPHVRRTRTGAGQYAVSAAEQM